MHENQQQLSELTKQVDDAFAALSIDAIADDVTALSEEMAAADFWNNSDHAQQVSKRHASLSKQAAPWLDLRSTLAEVQEFLSLDDASLSTEIATKLSAAQKDYQALKGSLRFSGKYDASDVVLTIQSGAGGTDAQDWTAMLLRMYTRWFEKNDASYQIVSEAPGEEAGFKSVSLTVSGAYMYGKLKSEHGVHRLVRLSPFNTANSRETSFAMVEVIPQIDSPEQIEINEKDLKIDVYRAGGRGGQSVNTTDSAVRITHIPTGITVAIQNERSQLQNKETAMTLMRSKLAQLARDQHKERVDDLKGPNQEAAWGNQIRSYVLHPYTMVKDARSGFQATDVQSVLDGDLDPITNAYLDATMGDTN